MYFLSASSSLEQYDMVTTNLIRRKHKGWYNYMYIIIYIIICCRVRIELSGKHLPQISPSTENRKGEMHCVLSSLVSNINKIQDTENSPALKKHS